MMLSAAKECAYMIKQIYLLDVSQSCLQVVVLWWFNDSNIFTNLLRYGKFEFIMEFATDNPSFDILSDFFFEVM